jgi:hypothetical protein
VSLADLILPYWQRVHAPNLENSSMQTISLACRAIFDDSNDGMTGKRFAKTTNSDAARYDGLAHWKPYHDGR